MFESAPIVLPQRPFSCPICAPCGHFPFAGGWSAGRRLLLRCRKNWKLGLANGASSNLVRFAGSQDCAITDCTIELDLHLATI